MSVSSSALSSFLEGAKPSWSEQERKHVYNKLVAIHVFDAQSLVSLLSKRGGQSLNAMLGHKGEKKFSADTLNLFRSHAATLGLIPGAVQFHKRTATTPEPGLTNSRNAKVTVVSDTMPPCMQKDRRAKPSCKQTFASWGGSQKSDPPAAMDRLSSLVETLGDACPLNKGPSQDLAGGAMKRASSVGARVALDRSAKWDGVAAHRPATAEQASLAAELQLIGVELVTRERMRDRLEKITAALARWSSMGRARLRAECRMQVGTVPEGSDRRDQLRELVCSVFPSDVAPDDEWNASTEVSGSTVDSAGDLLACDKNRLCKNILSSLSSKSGLATSKDRPRVRFQEPGVEEPFSGDEPLGAPVTDLQPPKVSKGLQPSLTQARRGDFHSPPGAESLPATPREEHADRCHPAHGLRSTDEQAAGALRVGVKAEAPHLLWDERRFWAAID